MIINETYSDLSGSQCRKCMNNNICKWQNEVIEVNKNISNIVFGKDLPIVVTVNCKRFANQNMVK